MLVCSVGREDLQQHLEQYYVPSSIVAVVAGALPAGEVEAALHAAMGRLPPRSPQLPLTTPETTAEPRLYLEARPTEQTNICLALPALSYRHPDRYVQVLLNTLLGAGMSSRLFQTVREERALAYNIYSTLRQHADCGALIIYAGVAPEQTAACLQAIWEELEHLAAEEVPEEELARAQEFNKGHILLRMEDTYGVASWYAGQEMLLGRIEEVDEVIARIEAVRPADVRRLATDIVRRERIRLAVIGPLADEGPLRQALGL